MSNRRKSEISFLDTHKDSRKPPKDTNRRMSCIKPPSAERSSSFRQSEGGASVSFGQIEIRVYDKGSDTTSSVPLGSFKQPDPVEKVRRKSLRSPANVKSASASSNSHGSPMLFSPIKLGDAIMEEQDHTEDMTSSSTTFGTHFGMPDLPAFITNDEDIPTVEANNGNSNQHNIAQRGSASEIPVSSNASVTSDIQPFSSSSSSTSSSSKLRFSVASMSSEFATADAETVADGVSLAGSSIVAATEDGATVTESVAEAETSSIGSDMEQTAEIPSKFGKILLQKNNKAIDGHAIQRKDDHHGWFDDVNASSRYSLPPPPHHQEALITSAPMFASPTATSNHRTSSILVSPAPSLHMQSQVFFTSPSSNNLVSNFRASPAAGRMSYGGGAENNNILGSAIKSQSGFAVQKGLASSSANSSATPGSARKGLQPISAQKLNARAMQPNVQPGSAVKAHQSNVIVVSSTPLNNSVVKKASKQSRLSLDSHTSIMGLEPIPMSIEDIEAKCNDNTPSSNDNNANNDNGDASADALGNAMSEAPTPVVHAIAVPRTFNQMDEFHASPSSTMKKATSEEPALPSAAAAAAAVNASMMEEVTTSLSSSVVETAATPRSKRARSSSSTSSSTASPTPTSSSDRFTDGAGLAEALANDAELNDLLGDEVADVVPTDATTSIARDVDDDGDAEDDDAAAAGGGAGAVDESTMAITETLPSHIVTHQKDREQQEEESSASSYSSQDAEVIMQSADADADTGADADANADAGSVMETGTVDMDISYAPMSSHFVHNAQARTSEIGTDDGAHSHNGNEYDHGNNDVDNVDEVGNDDSFAHAFEERQVNPRRLTEAEMDAIVDQDENMSMEMTRAITNTLLANNCSFVSNTIHAALGNQVSQQSPPAPAAVAVAVAAAPAPVPPRAAVDDEDAAADGDTEADDSTADTIEMTSSSTAMDITAAHPSSAPIIVHNDVDVNSKSLRAADGEENDVEEDTIETHFSVSSVSDDGGTMEFTMALPSNIHMSRLSTASAASSSSSSVIAAAVCGAIGEENEEALSVENARDEDDQQAQAEEQQQQQHQRFQHEEAEESGEDMEMATVIVPIISISNNNNMNKSMVSEPDVTEDMEFTTVVDTSIRVSGHDVDADVDVDVDVDAASATADNASEAMDVDAMDATMDVDNAPTATAAETSSHAAPIEETGTVDMDITYAGGGLIHTNIAHAAPSSPAQSVMTSASADASVVASVNAGTVSPARSTLYEETASVLPTPDSSAARAPVAATYAAASVASSILFSPAAAAFNPSTSLSSSSTFSTASASASAAANAPVSVPNSAMKQPTHMHTVPNTPILSFSSAPVPITAPLPASANTAARTAAATPVSATATASASLAATPSEMNTPNERSLRASMTGAMTDVTVATSTSINASDATPTGGAHRGRETRRVSELLHELKHFAEGNESMALPEDMRMYLQGFLEDNATSTPNSLAPRARSRRSSRVSIGSRLSFSPGARSLAPGGRRSTVGFGTISEEAETSFDSNGAASTGTVTMTASATASTSNATGKMKKWRQSISSETVAENRELRKGLEDDDDEDDDDLDFGGIDPSDATISGHALMHLPPSVSSTSASHRHSEVSDASMDATENSEFTDSLIHSNKSQGRRRGRSSSMTNDSMQSVTDSFDITDQQTDDILNSSATISSPAFRKLASKASSSASSAVPIGSFKMSEHGRNMTFTEFAAAMGAPIESEQRGGVNRRDSEFGLAAGHRSQSSSAPLPAGALEMDEDDEEALYDVMVEDIETQTYTRGCVDLADDIKTMKAAADATESLLNSTKSSTTFGVFRRLMMDASASAESQRAVQEKMRRLVAFGKKQAQAAWYKWRASLLEETRSRFEEQVKDIQGDVDASSSFADLFESAFAEEAAANNPAIVKLREVVLDLLDYYDEEEEAREEATKALETATAKAEALEAEAEEAKRFLIEAEEDAKRDSVLEMAQARTAGARSLHLLAQQCVGWSSVKRLVGSTVGFEMSLSQPSVCDVRFALTARWRPTDGSMSEFRLARMVGDDVAAATTTATTTTSSNNNNNAFSCKKPSIVNIHGQTQARALVLGLFDSHSAQFNALRDMCNNQSKFADVAAQIHLMLSHFYDMAKELLTVMQDTYVMVTKPSLSSSSSSSSLPVVHISLTHAPTMRQVNLQLTLSECYPECDLLPIVEVIAAGIHGTRAGPETAAMLRDAVLEIVRSSSGYGRLKKITQAIRAHLNA